MTDPNHKTLVDLKPYGAAPASHVDDTVRDLDAARPPAAQERDAFDPYKFQSHPMPPGLRAEILEHAGQRAAAAAREAQSSHPANECSVIVDEETQRVADTVLIKRVVRRRFRRRVLAVGVVFGSLGAALAVWTREPKPKTTVALPAQQPPRPLPSSALPQASPPSISHTRAAEARAAASLAPVASFPQIPPPLAAASSSVALTKAQATRRAATAPRRGLAPVKPTASNATAAGTDLLNFEGPAPK